MTKKRNETLETFLRNSVLLIDKVINTTGFKKLFANHRQFAKFSIDLNEELKILFLIENKKSLQFVRRLKIKIRSMRIRTINYALV